MTRNATEPGNLNTVKDLKNRLQSKQTTPQQAFFELVRFVIPNVSKLNNTDEETTVKLFSSDPVLGPIFHDGEHLWNEYLGEHPYGPTPDDRKRASEERELYKKYQEWKKNLREEKEILRRAI